MSAPRTLFITTNRTLMSRTGQLFLSKLHRPHAPKAAHVPSHGARTLSDWIHLCPLLNPAGAQEGIWAVRDFTDVPPML